MVKKWSNLGVVKNNLNEYIKRGKYCFLISNQYEKNWIQESGIVAMNNIFTCTYVTLVQCK